MFWRKLLAAAALLSCSVEWPDGSKETWDKIQSDALVTLRQGTGRPK